MNEKLREEAKAWKEKIETMLEKEAPNAFVGDIKMCASLLDDDWTILVNIHEASPQDYELQKRVYDAIGRDDLPIEVFLEW
ncbi:hypothetical protein [Hydrogenimonas urashimensis]|uniref:hypothetical protein n=1 Tax=Hydrogenimonas urashimensis TaxID=2740515 RepID=UPI001915D765|nr:hypothetical protein [Hydrogenimonas urashimensis]